MSRLTALCIAGALAAAAPAFAGVTFDNPFDYGSGTCSFNTTCGSRLTGDTYAAQKFSIAAPRTIVGGRLITLSLADEGSVNWQIRWADASTGLPGSQMYAGNAPIHYYRPYLGNFLGAAIFSESYDLPAMTLAAGSYYLALQYVTPSFNVFLGSASAFGGAAQSNDGGATWAPGYGGGPGIAVTLYDNSWMGSVPEPASWAMMISGFGLIGAQLRRRRVPAVSAA